MSVAYSEHDAVGVNSDDNTILATSFITCALWSIVMMHVMCRYISSLFKPNARGEMLYLMCVSNDEERANAIGAFQSRAMLVAASFSCWMKLCGDLTE